MAHRSPAQIQTHLEAKRTRMDMPEQTLGDEPNSYRKPWESAATRTCIFACWPYEQAAGNQAIPMVYQTINDYPSYDNTAPHLADRSYFYASPRDLALALDNGIPVYGVESKHQLADFDVIGTSISYPVLSINLIKQLIMSDIPPTWEDRSDSTGKVFPGRMRNPEVWPMVMCGGQSYGAPEVIANVVDVWFAGEVEDEPGNPGLGAVLDRIRVFKLSGRWSKDRLSCYKSLATEFSFLYFPALFDIHYGYEQRSSVVEARSALNMEGEPEPSKQVQGITSSDYVLPMPVTKRFVKDLDAIRGLDNPPLLYVDPGLGTGDAETSRGCPAWCSFCALTYRQKPYRQRGVPKMVDFTKKLLQNTGGTHIAPFGPDFPMHTEKNGLIAGLLEHVSDDIDASSMRVDDFIADPRYILLQAHAGMNTVTLGVEGNSQRMRDLIGKGAADEDVKEAVARAIQAGIKKIKLYMISSLPGEDEKDIYRIMRLAKDLADIREGLSSRTMIQLSWTPLLIEANTPMQWFAPTPPNYALGSVWEEFRSLNIEFKLGGKSQKDRHAYFQLSQRASREIGMAMVEAICEINKGTWGGVAPGSADLVAANLVRHGFLNSFADAYDERAKKDMFGWELMDQGINTELMWKTYQQMKEFLELTDSETYDQQLEEDYHGSEWIPRCDSACQGKSCGVCDATDLKIRRNYITAASRELNVDLTSVKVIDQKTVAMRVRAKYVTHESKRVVATRHWKYALRRAAYRAGVPVTKRDFAFASGQLKYKDWTCGVDYVEFGLTRKVEVEELEPLLQKMNEELGSDIQLTDWALRFPTDAALRAEVDLNLFELELDHDQFETQSRIDTFLQTEYVPMVIREESYGAGLKRETVNARDLVDDMWLVREGGALRIAMLIRGKANPYLVYASLFGKNTWIDSARYPAIRVESFYERKDAVFDLFSSDCQSCAGPIPSNLLDRAYNPEYCPRCFDEHEGRALTQRMLK